MNKMGPVPLWSSFNIFLKSYQPFYRWIVYWKNVDAASEWGWTYCVSVLFLISLYFFIHCSAHLQIHCRGNLYWIFFMLPQKRVEPIVLRIDRSTRRWLWLWLSVCQHTDTDLTENPHCPRSTLFYHCTE